MMVPVVLCIARNRLPHPEKLEIAHESGSKDNTLFSKTFVLYSLFTFFAVAGFANFPLIAYHLKMKTIVGDAQIPALFALAMGVDALTALIIGKTYDRMGLKILIIVPLLSFFIPLLAFSDMLVGVIIGTILWGIVLGIHETIMRAAVADLTDINRRGSAYGIFNTLYGLSWLLGGTLMGMLYEHSVYTLMLLAALFEVVSIPLFLMLAKSLKSR
jgi:predicted MFS family arabinose efflux permease